MEPVFFLSYPLELYFSLFKAHGVSAVLNLTASDGNCELAAIELNLPCVSVCLTEMHTELLYKRLDDLVVSR